MAGKSRISRRKFVAAAAAIGAAPLLPEAIADARAQQPKRGGRLRLGLGNGGPTDNLDPALIIDAVQQNISYQARNTLVELLPTMEAGPELAESWEASPDAKVWRFKLRQGVTFHNGKTMDAEDVVFSLNLHHGPNSKSGAKGLMSGVQDIKADGKNTVVVTLSGGNADFPLTLTDYHMVVVPADSKNVGDGMGTGPYVLDKYEPGVRAFAKRNANYFRNDRGFFDEVETFNINDASARTNALIAGQVDVINRLELKVVSLLEQNKQIKVSNVSGFKYASMPMMTNTAPYNNLDVRLAMKHAIDRKEVLSTVLRGYGFVGNDNPLSPSHRFFNKDLPQRAFDLDKAKFHIKKSGLEGTTFEIATADVGFDGAVDMAILFQQTAGKAGINVKLNRVPVDGFWRSVWNKVPFCTSYWASRPSEDAAFSLGYARGAGMNDTKWSPDRFQELLVAARGELDNNKRRAMYYEMQQILWDDGGQIVPVWVNHIAATSLKIAMPAKISGSNEMDGHRCAERWWFA
ncbi:MAG: ABC transporter substrate-binding protein [Pseudorhodoplanes sp.]